MVAVDVKTKDGTCSGSEHFAGLKTPVQLVFAPKEIIKYVNVKMTGAQAQGQHFSVELSNPQRLIREGLADPEQKNVRLGKHASMKIKVFV